MWLSFLLLHPQNHIIPITPHHKEMCICMCIHLYLSAYAMLIYDGGIKCWKRRERKERELCYEHPLIVSHRYIRFLPRGIRRATSHGHVCSSTILLPPLKGFISLILPTRMCLAWLCVYAYICATCCNTHTSTNTTTRSCYKPKCHTFKQQIISI